MRWLLGAAAACTVLAIVIGIVPTGQFLGAVAITLGGTAFVLLVSASFLAVGQSEDRAREREAAERAKRGP